MTFPVIVQSMNGHYVAELLGAPHVRVIRETRDQALDGLQAEIAKRVRQEELLYLEVEPRRGVTALAGKYKDDPSLREICEEAYRLRDEEAAGLGETESQE